jgi:hypothetical protein
MMRSNVEREHTKKPQDKLMNRLLHPQPEWIASEWAVIRAKL